MIPKPLAVAIVCLVTLVWLGNFAAQFLVPGYTADGWVHAIFLATVGGALGLSRKGSDEPKDSGGTTVASILQNLANAAGNGGHPPPPPPVPGEPEPPPGPGPPEPPAGPRHSALDLLPWRLA